MAVDKLELIIALFAVTLLSVIFRMFMVSLSPRVRCARAAVPRVTESRLASETRSAAALYDLAWGKSWPHHVGIIYKSELGQVNTEDELYFDGGVDAIPESFAYHCLEDIGKVRAGLSMTAGVADVLVVREEYDVVRKILGRNSPLFNAFAVTGHPGIGKTTFLIYLLLYRLERKLPTAVQLSNDYYLLFDEYGACAISLPYDDADYDCRLMKCWALSNCKGSVINPCDVFQCRAERLIQVTPLEPRKWKGVADITVVDLPKVLEIGAVLKEHRLDVGATLGLVGKWGPSISTIIALVEDPKLVSRYHHAAAEASRALAAMPSSALVLSKIGHLPTSSSSCSILFICSGDGFRAPLATCIIPTKFLSEFFDLHPRCPTSAKHSIDLFEWLRGSHSLTHTIDWMHKAKMHFRLCTAGTGIRLNGILNQEQIVLRPCNHVLSGTEASLRRAPTAQSFYWAPLGIDYPGIDGILGDSNGEVFALQAATLVDYVDPHDGLQRAWAATSPRTHCPWNYVLVCEKQKDVEELLEFVAPHLEDLEVGDHCSVKLWVCNMKTS